MLDSTRSSSIHGNDFLELVWENGEIVARGSGSSSRIQHIDEDGSITKRTSRLNPLSYSLQDHHFPPQTQRDSDMNSSHQTINAQDSSQSSQQTKNYSNNLNEEFANLFRPVVVVKDSNNPVTTGNINSHHLQQQCSLPSSPLKKPRTPKVNFSNFSIPAVFLKSTTSQQTKNHSSPARVEDIKKSSAKESDGFQQQTSLTVERSTKPVDNDEQYSQAVLGIHRSQGQLRCDQTSTTAEEALRANKAKAYNNNTNTCHEPLLASSSVCSLGASNDPNLSFRKHEDTDDSTYLSDNDDGEPEDMVKQEREGSRVKRSRNTEVHNLSEKKRREKINKKMRTLKELIPNCNKVDKASMLDDAIDYLKTLKLQLQVMSMGSGLWPVMNMMNGPHLGQLGMGFRAAQVPIPDNRLQMFGFPNQIVTMPHAHAPFFPIIANSATQPHLPTTNTTNLAQHLANSAAAAAAASLHATKLAPTQVSFQHLGTSLPLATPFIFPQK